MKGLYLNVPAAEAGIRERARRLGVEASPIAVELGGGERAVVWTEAEDWEGGPVWRSPEGGGLAVASGWMIFDGRWGALPAFAEAFLEAPDDEARRGVLARIDAGAFLILVQAADRRFLVTDPFGLHPHYHGPQGPLARVAPAPAYLGLELEVDPIQQGILAKVHYLFGDDTLYRGVKRLGPGRAHVDGGTFTWFDWRGTDGDAAAIREALEAFLDSVPRGPRLLPLSGGLDSRLLAALRPFDVGYTYGPASSGDRPIARRFRDRFTREHVEFSLLDLNYPDRLREVGQEMFDGICDVPFVELLAVYGSARARWGRAVLFDGYAGGVLQRGAYLAGKGWRGRLGKLWPATILRNLDGEELIQARYPSLSQDERGPLRQAWRDTVADLDLDPARKVVLFELLYGRGARHTLNGGTTMAGQYFTVVQPFYVPSVFKAFFGVPMEDVLSFRLLGRLWRGLPSRYAVAAPTGLVPVWPGHLARVAMLAWHSLGKLGIHSHGRDYGAEVAAIRWTPPESDPPS